MKQITLTKKPRTELGRTASRHLRENGVVPAVIYGESGNSAFGIGAHDFMLAHRKFAGSAALFELKEAEGEDSTFAIIQELQRNPRNESFVHIDFKEIVRGQDMEADIPVHTFGTADGVKNFGGILELGAHTLRVRCRPRNLPETITVDVTKLEIGKSMHLGEINPPEGVTFLDDPDFVLVSCVGASGGASGVTEEGDDDEGEEAVASEETGAGEGDNT